MLNHSFVSGSANRLIEDLELAKKLIDQHYDCGINIIELQSHINEMYRERLKLKALLKYKKDQIHAASIELKIAKINNVIDEIKNISDQIMYLLDKEEQEYQDKTQDIVSKHSILVETSKSINQNLSKVLKEVNKIVAKINKQQTLH